MHGRQSKDSWDPKKFQKIVIHDSKVISRLNLLPNLMHGPWSETEEYILLPNDICYYQWLDIEETIKGNGDFLKGKTVWQLLTIAKNLDFFGWDDELKSAVEERIKLLINETNCREVLDNTKTILGLDNIAVAALNTIIGRQDELDISQLKEYAAMPMHVIKHVLRSKFDNERNKIHILEYWIIWNWNPNHQAAALQMLSLIDLRKLVKLSGTEEIAQMVKSWLTVEQFTTFTGMLEEVRQEIRQQQELEEARWQQEQELRWQQQMERGRGRRRIGG